ncbi:MAG TPA: hypothetical protein VL283_03020 [Candidatus Baltobacteraceae bacterium]|nr:hypothetical protein [Candidatus Baltobacteraceae bacterium]
MTGKERLKRAIEGLPLDSAQRKAAEEGLRNMGDAEAAAAADDLEEAVDDLPPALDSVDALLRAYEKGASRH